MVNGLALLPGPDDPRWETFGLNVPNSLRPPDPAESLVLTSAVQLFPTI